MSDPVRTPVDDPSLVQVEPASRCNLRCQMCPVTTKGTLSTQDPGVMSAEVWATVRQTASRIGRVILTGFGEPLLHPDFLDMLRELDARRVMIGFSTNGILVTDDIARELAAIHSLAHVNVSIDSPDPDVYREVRRGDVRKALDGLGRLVRGLRPDTQLVTVSSLLMANTAESLVRFPRVLSEIGVRHWRVQCMADWNGDLTTWHLVRGGVNTYRDRIRAEADAHGIDLVFENPERTDMEADQPALAVRTYHTKAETTAGESRLCNAPWDSPFVDKDGRVLPCCYADHTAVLGDLRDDTFDAIWNGEKYHQFRDALVRGGRSLPQICANCTQAPAGVHPRGQFAAELCHAESVLTGPGPYRLVVRNVGLNSWDQASCLRVGVPDVGGGPSAFAHAGWLSPNRVGTFSEEVVPPGGKATFEFHCTRGGTLLAAGFQLVADGLRWVANTRFVVAIDPEPVAEVPPVVVPTAVQVRRSMWSRWAGAVVRVVTAGTGHRAT